MTIEFDSWFDFKDAALDYAKEKYDQEIADLHEEYDKKVSDLRDEHEKECNRLDELVRERQAKIDEMTSGINLPNDHQTLAWTLARLCAETYPTNCRQWIFDHYRSLSQNEKISGIKFIRNLLGIGLAQAKDWIDSP